MMSVMERERARMIEYWTELDVLEELEGMALQAVKYWKPCHRAPPPKRESLQVI